MQKSDPKQFKYRNRRRKNQIKPYHYPQTPTSFRFFCPPPCVYLLGDGWKLKRTRLESLLQKYRDHAKGSPDDRNDHERFVEAQCAELRAQIGIQGSVEQEPQHLDFSNGKVGFFFVLRKRILHELELDFLG
jgi:hypothetical protein